MGGMRKVRRYVLRRQPLTPRRFGSAGALLVVLAMLGMGAVLSSVVVSNSTPELELTACFSYVGGLEPGDDVTLNGVYVGEVDALTLDADQRPCAQLSLRADLQIDQDTSAAIFTKNMLGEKYVALDPGGSEELLTTGSEIHYTQSALPLERILIRLIESQLESGTD